MSDWERCWYEIEAALRVAMPNHKLRDLAEAVRDLARQRDLLWHYARHDGWCEEIISGGPCDCGWTDLREEVFQPCEEKTDVRDEHAETA